MAVKTSQKAFREQIKGACASLIRSTIPHPAGHADKLNSSVKRTHATCVQGLRPIPFI